MNGEVRLQLPGKQTQNFEIDHWLAELDSEGNFIDRRGVEGDGLPRVGDGGLLVAHEGLYIIVA